MSVLTRHWELKLLALAFAAALWLFVMTSEQSDLILSAPIEIDGVPAGLVISGELPESVDVQLHGLRGTLARLARDQLKARVNMAGAQPGEVTLRILPEHITVPPGVTVLRVNPSRIRLVLAPGESTPQTPRS
jgi:YbbR domain-containing protein